MRVPKTLAFLLTVLLFLSGCGKSEDEITKLTNWADKQSWATRFGEVHVKRDPLLGSFGTIQAVRVKLRANEPISLERLGEIGKELERFPQEIRYQVEIQTGEHQFRVTSRPALNEGNFRHYKRLLADPRVIRLNHIEAESYDYLEVKVQAEDPLKAASELLIDDGAEIRFGFASDAGWEIKNSLAAEMEKTLQTVQVGLRVSENFVVSNTDHLRFNNAQIPLPLETAKKIRQQPWDEEIHFCFSGAELTLCWSANPKDSVETRKVRVTSSTTGRTIFTPSPRQQQIIDQTIKNWNSAG